ncbi:hypothetical protein EW145_g8327 [Phellinidium pouzarii]|uniref:Mediator of RNA polymerase II transcription subunit 7 n=1 Tax=Phellinidium pouzarii TaxID=167371 RepID=A0A4V3X9C3_9AGAM|nr:hypothetical protein EW145_g8327 [Phellinidium pouzarii]
MIDDEDGAELRNPFPSPPSHYQQYTTHNVRLLTLLKSRLAEPGSADEEKDQRKVLADQTDVPEWPLTQLEKPRVDWILEEGHYTVFGDTWFVKEKIPSLGELGGQQLYPEDPTIVTYSRLLKSLLIPPPGPGPHSTEPAEWHKHVEWLNVMSQNIMSAANDLRPVQARFNLEAMMTRQLELRREETASIRKKCDDLQRRLLELKIAAKDSRKDDQLRQKREPRPALTIQPTSMEDVFRWAEGS